MTQRILLNLHSEAMRIIDAKDVDVQHRKVIPIAMGLELITNHQTTTPLAGGQNRTVLALSQHNALALAIQILTQLGMTVEPRVMETERQRSGENNPPTGWKEPKPSKPLPMGT